jgi:UDPglucose 6-dehydrogenase
VSREVSPDYKVAIIGNGWVGQAYNKMFPDAVVYDEPKHFLKEGEKVHTEKFDQELGRAVVNACDMALVAVPTDPIEKDGKSELDMSIVEDVVQWLDTPLILIKSALQPGTVDRLVEETGKKIAVSVEMVGEGKYFVPYWRYPHAEDPTYHSFLIVGGETETASACADFLWRKMSPDIDIHILTAVEAEITKLMENAWGAQKVTFANVMYDICKDMGADYTRVLQAWGADGRTEKMHMRVLPNKRGWKSKCYDKDVPALADLDGSGFLKSMVKVNEIHQAENQTT